MANEITKRVCSIVGGAAIGGVMAYAQSSKFSISTFAGDVIRVVVYTMVGGFIGGYLTGS